MNFFRLLSLGSIQAILVIFISGLVAVDCLAQSTAADNRRLQLDRVEKYVNALLERFDINKDGFLDDAEMDVMRARPNNVDRNSDGRASIEELFFYYSGGRSLVGASPTPEALATVELDLRVFRLSEEMQLPEEKVRWSELLSKTPASLSIQATMICGRESSFQVGQTLPRVVGQSVNGRQGTSRQVNMVDVGSILKLTPSKNGDDWVLDLQLEHSGVQPTDDPLVQPIERLQVNQSLSVAGDGTAASIIQHNGVRWVVLVNAKN